jgi:hypothetical protein
MFSSFIFQTFQKKRKSGVSREVGRSSKWALRGSSFKGALFGRSSKGASLLEEGESNKDLCAILGEFSGSIASQGARLCVLLIEFNTYF